jgi:hypothetical protein
VAQQGGGRPGVAQAEPRQSFLARRRPSGAPRVQQHVGQRYRVQRVVGRLGQHGEPEQALGEQIVGRLGLGLAQQAPAQQDGSRGGVVVVARAPPDLTAQRHGAGGRYVAGQRVRRPAGRFAVGDGQQVEGEPAEAVDERAAPAAEGVPAERVAAPGEQTDAHAVSTTDATGVLSRWLQRRSGEK